VGIDIEDKSYLNNPAKNIFTIQADSSNIEANMQLIKSLGVRHFDFIFIDGWHSINQCLRDWEYTSMLSDDGIVGFHDTRIHPGPHRFMTSLKTQVWHVEENVCRYGEDWGIGFARKLKIS
jgi:predicted O-methyltransferase YrrM